LPTLPGLTTTPTTTPTVTTTQPEDVFGTYGDISVFDCKPDGTPIYPDGQWGLYGTWTSFNYISGVRVDRNSNGYQPFYLVNRVDTTTVQGILGTEVDETTASIPLNKDLHDADISSVVVKSYQDRKVKNPDGTTDVIQVPVDEKIVPLSYDAYSRMLEIGGLLPDIERRLVITYMPDSDFVLSVSIDHDPSDGYVVASSDVVSWVTFEQATFTLPPDSVAPIYMMMEVPRDVVLPEYWQFWIKVEISAGKGQAGSVVVNIAQQKPIKVKMIY